MGAQYATGDHVVLQTRGGRVPAADQFGTVTAREGDARVVVKTAGGRERLIRLSDPVLRRASVIEELFKRERFPRLWFQQHAV